MYANIFSRVRRCLSFVFTSNSFSSFGTFPLVAEICKCSFFFLLQMTVKLFVMGNHNPSHQHIQHITWWHQLSPCSVVCFVAKTSHHVNITSFPSWWNYNSIATHGAFARFKMQVSSVNGPQNKPSLTNQQFYIRMHKHPVKTWILQKWFVRTGYAHSWK